MLQFTCIFIFTIINMIFNKNNLFYGPRYFASNDLFHNEFIMVSGENVRNEQNPLYTVHSMEIRLIWSKAIKCDGLFLLSDSDSDLDWDSKSYDYTALCRTCLQWLGFRFRSLSQIGTVPIYFRDRSLCQVQISIFYIHFNQGNSLNLNQWKNAA